MTETISQGENMITRDEILMGREKAHPLSKAQEANLERLLKAANEVRKAYGKPMVVSSGYRPAAINAAVGGAKRSNHMECLAVDFRDTDGSLVLWCLNNLALLKSIGFYMEDPRWTKGWVHLQIIAPRSGKRIFIPAAGTPPHPQAWDGKYDPKHD